MKRRGLYLIAAVLIAAAIGVTSAEDNFAFPDTDGPLGCSITQYEFNTGLEIYISPSYSAERIFAVQGLSPYVAARDLSGEWLYIFFFYDAELMGGWVPLVQVAVPLEDYYELCVGSGGVVPDMPNLSVDESAVITVEQEQVTSPPSSIRVPTSRPPASGTPVPPTNTPTDTPVAPSDTPGPTATEGLPPTVIGPPPSATPVTPTDTPIGPSDTPGPTVTEGQGVTLSPTAEIPTLTPSDTPTEGPGVTFSPTSSPTDTPTMTPYNLPSSTP